MRQYKARLVYKDEDKPPIIIDIDEEVIIRRSLEKYSVVCEKGLECFSFGMFDPSVSGGKGHAKIFWEKDRLYIQDMGSSNGTYLLINKKEVLLRGWRPAISKEGPTPSEMVRINKTQRVLLGTMEFTVELEPIQKIHIEGDFLAEGASKVTITDSIIQRSVIGGVSSKGSVTSELKMGGQIDITDSVVVRSSIGNTPGRCPHCGKEVKVDLRMCNRCGEKL